MFLKSIRVYENWQARAQLGQAGDRLRWRGALVAVVLSPLLVLLFKAIPIPTRSTWFLAGELASALYLMVGLIAFARVPAARRYVFALGYGLIVLCALLGDLAIEQSLANDLQGQWTGLLFLGIVVLTLIVPSWSLLGWVFFKDRKDLTQGLDRAWWLSELGYGLAVAALVALLVFLSDSLSGLELPFLLPPIPLLFQQAGYALGLRAPGEEIFFRGIVYQYLYRRLGKGFWTATLITVPMNLAIYLVQLPRLDSPPLVALTLIGACIMTIASSALYAWRGSLVAPIINNALYQVFAFALGLS